MIISGILGIAGAAWFASHLRTMRQLMHPIYRTLGIIPEIATGIQNASALQTPPEE